VAVGTTAPYSEAAAIGYGAGHGRGEAGKPKEIPYYPSSIGMFFPFGSAASAATTSKSPFATLRPSESPPVVSKEGANNINTSTTTTSTTVNRDTAPSGPGDSEISSAATTKPFYYPGSSSSHMQPGNGVRDSPRETVQERSVPDLLEDGDAGWDDYSKAVRYDDLPCVASTDSLDASSSSSTSTTSRPPRTAFRVSSVPLKTVLARIATYLKIHSVTCDPKGLVRDGDGTLACVTRRHCQFAITIWRLEGQEGGEFGRAPGTASIADESPAVLVAIERRQGCCVELQRMRQALKLAIETGRFPSATEGKAASVGCHSMPSSSSSSRRNPMTIAPLIKELYERQQATGSEPGSAPVPAAAAETKDSAESPNSVRAYGSSVRRRSSLDGISTCASLLASQCLYKQQLGLENLVAMTDPSRGVDLETARDVTDALLLPHHPSHDPHGHRVPPTIPSSSDSSDGDNEEEGDDELFKRLQQEFISFFVSSEESFHDVTQSQAFSLTVSPAPTAPKTFPDLTESPLQRTIRHSLALEALCNALQVTKTACRCGSSPTTRAADGTPFTTMGNTACAGPCLRAGAHLDLGSDFWRAVIPALLLDVTNARSRPHDAALSAKCLALLQDLHQHKVGDDAPPATPSTPSSRPLDCLMCLDYVETLLPYLVQARAYGSRHHLLLEREANELIGRLQRQRQEGRRRPQSPVRRLPPSTQLQSF
jgi:hypothetical protein